MAYRPVVTISYCQRQEYQHLIVMVQRKMNSDLARRKVAFSLETGRQCSTIYYKYSGV